MDERIIEQPEVSPEQLPVRLKRLWRSWMRYKKGFNKTQECARRLRQGDRLEMRRWPEDF